MSRTNGDIGSYGKPHSTGFTIQAFFSDLGVDASTNQNFIESLPFTHGDVTAGSESEIQTVVIGTHETVDLPRYILASNYFANIKKRHAVGETPARTVMEIEEFIRANKEGIWDNSWVRFPRRMLNETANRLLDFDLLADKSDPLSGRRKDGANFLFFEQGEEFVRLPVSYVLKLALSDAISPHGSHKTVDIVERTGSRLLGHFISDNTSPETHSFYITPLMQEFGGGKAVAAETSKRLLFTHLLSAYANEKFGLKTSGQQVVVFNSPHPPVRLKRLNECISDSFYRELFANPCLSGWDEGQKKYAYMKLCHEVLSRSQLNTIAKLRDAGIITNNLIVVPNVSNICLSNNGTHLSIGSLRLTDALNSSAICAEQEKYTADLVVKIFEHFLPLFIGSYSAAAYRLEFSDFHPEKILGFLPHELHYTHLRMLWRRWKKKARFKILNRPVTPFGPDFIDKTISRLFNFKGDYVDDYRLINYLVAVLSTESSPSLDGSMGNEQRLKHDLMHMGVFDERMSTYLFYRMRKCAEIGYSGYEGRYYSLFDSISTDMGNAAELQTLITLYAYYLLASGLVTHADIPDTPFVESERRQITFCTAIGIPTFYVRNDTKNQVLKKILLKTKRIRSSARYQGFQRVLTREYLSALIQVLETGAASLIELLGLRRMIADLKQRIESPSEFSTSARITRGILNEAGVSSAFKLPADEFNESAEKYYRTILRLKHLKEGFDLFRESLLLGISDTSAGKYRNSLKSITGNSSIEALLDSTEDSLFNETISLEEIRRLIHLMIVDCRIEGDRYNSIISNTMGGN